MLEMKRFVKIALGLAAATVLGAGHAQAATWLLNYIDTNGAAPTEATLAVQALDTLNAVGGYDITGVTGNVDGDAVTGLIANPAQPYASYSADGMFIFDNVVYANAPPLLSNPGLFFSGASGNEYNLFSDSPAVYELYQARPGVAYLEHSVGVLSAQKTGRLGGLADLGQAAIPEPAAWTMMILGFGGVGAILRRRRTAPTPA
jgi:hypothetical protein